jgi:hypothetical protein
MRSGGWCSNSRPDRIGCFRVETVAVVGHQRREHVALFGPSRGTTNAHHFTRTVFSWSHAGESRDGDAGNRGCEVHRFGESRIDAEKRAGDAAFARTRPKTAATAVVNRRDPAGASERFTPD